jgi:hypothetical protein
MSKLIRACVAVAAVAAFTILPATASATNNPQLTESGTALSTGVAIYANNVNSTFFTDTSGNTLVDCSNAELSGTLTKNSIGAVEGEITTFDFWGTGSIHPHNGLPECTGSFGNAFITVVNSPLCVRSTNTMATNEFQVSSGKCPGGGKVKFIIGSTTVGECEYETGGVVKGDYKTNTSEMTVRNTLAGSGASKIRGGFLCPGSGMLKMTFTLKTGNGTAITIS